MIIVSQDKSKITQRLEFYIQENYGTDEELRYEIRSIGGGVFGGYKTEERAKEVLQDIISRYEEIELCKNKSSEDLGYTLADYTPIYEMPKE